MEFFDTYFVTPINNILWSHALIYMLIAVGVYFTLRTKFVQFRHFGHMIKLLTESTKSASGEKSISGSFLKRVGNSEYSLIVIYILFDHSRKSILSMKGKMK